MRSKGTSFGGIRNQSASSTSLPRRIWQILFESILRPCPASKLKMNAMDCRFCGASEPTATKPSSRLLSICSDTRPQRSVPRDLYKQFSESIGGCYPWSHIHLLAETKRPLLYSRSSTTRGFSHFFIAAGQAEAQFHDGRDPCLMQQREAQDGGHYAAEYNGNRRRVEGMPLAGRRCYGLLRRTETIVRLLLQNGADVESKDTSGWTPLSWAARKGQEPSCDFCRERRRRGVEGYLWLDVVVVGRR